MTSCDCPHPPALHASAQDTGLAFCMHPACDCEGTRDQVAAMLASRIARSADSKLERLVSLIREVTSNPMPRSIDDQARNVAAAIVASFELEERR